MKKVAFLSMFVVAFAFGAGLTLATSADAQTSSNNNWSGLYIGGNVGAARNHDTGTMTCINLSGVVNGTGCPTPGLGMASGNGGIIGGQIGYNFQFQHFVAGVEGDIQNSTIQARSAFNGTLTCIGGGSAPGIGYTAISNITTLGTERLRLGYLASPNMLLYATGGFAQGIVNLKQSFASPIGGTEYPMNVTLRTNGFAEGIGGELAVQKHLSVKLEALMFNLRNLVPYVYTAPGITTGYQTGKDFEFHGALLRLGFNWKF